MVLHRHARGALFGLMAMLMSGAAWADPIPGLYDTGLNAQGQRLSGNGEQDAHYQVNGHPAVAYYNGAYYLRDDSMWIGELGGGGYTAPFVDGKARTYYTISFDLTGLNPATARISGSWGVDNYGVAYINGQPFSTNSAGFSAPTGFSITSGFKPGVNTITFMVEDYGAPAAFIVSGLQGTADKATPPAWSAGSWGAWSSSCGSASRTRPVTCIDPDSGETIADSSCSAATKPTASEASYQTSGCGYDWTPGSYGAPAPACGATVMTRTVSCTRSDGQPADASQCDPAKKPQTEAPATSYDTCSYSWTADPWSTPSSSCGPATQTRTVSCWRSDQKAVDDSLCAQAGAKPATSQSTYQTSGCSFSWNEGAWSGPVPACGPTVENRAVTCVRSDGQPAADVSCPAGTRPADQRAGTSYATCGYTWEAGSWSAPTRTCGSSTRTRTVVCRRSDGSQVGDKLCTGTHPDTVETVSDFSSCTHAWSYGAWSQPAPACGATTETREAECVRQDDVVVADDLCPAPEPLTRVTSDYSACSFRWDAGAWSTPSACGQTTRTRPVSCLRSDGTTAPETQCDAPARPASSEQVQDTTTCQYSWVQTSVGQWSACIGGSQSRTVTAECRRSDGSVVADALCGTRPSDETRGCTSPVTPTPTPGSGDGKGEVIFRRVIDVSR